MTLAEMLQLDMSYWGRSRRLVILILCIWALVGFGLPALVIETNRVHFLGFPLGYYNSAQVIPLFFCACLVVFNHVQEGIEDDQIHGKPAGEAAASSSLNTTLMKVYVAYTGGFILFVLFLGLLEAVGVPDQAISILFVIFTLGMYAGFGIASRTSKSDDYYVAGRRVPPVFNGMATAADWMSGASFVGMAGTLFSLGYDGLAYIVGWTGGYVLVSTLIAPYLRRFGSFTVPDFIASRYKGTVHLPGGKVLDLTGVARLLATMVLVSCSFTYLTAQVYSTGLIVSRFIGLKFEVAVFSGLIGVLFCSLLGGMRAVTWTQVAQYVIIIIAYTVPAICMSTAQDDGYNKNNPVAQIAYGSALQAISRREVEMVALGLASKVDPYLEPKWRRVDFFALSFCLMVGTASLPHVLMRYFTTSSVRSARRSVTWSLAFILVLYLTAPAYAAFAKLEVYTGVIGQPLSALPQWIFTYGKIGLTSVCGEAVTSVDEAIAACAQAAGGNYLLKLEDLKISTDAIVIATPEIAGLPYTIAGLVSAGGLAASLSTADGLLLAISNALSHDIYFRLIDDNASVQKRMLISRVLLVAIALLAAGTAASKPADILSMVAWAFSLAASGNFPALALGIWWRRANAQGAVAGIISGWSLTVAYMLGTRYGGWGLWGGISNVSAAVFGIPVGFGANIIVSLLTPPPPDDMMAMVDSLRDFKATGESPTAEESADGQGEEFADDQALWVSDNAEATVEVSI